MHRLFGCARDKGCRITILSGDVHVAALGALISTRDGQEAVINQLVSSAIVHPPPPGVACFYLQQCASHEEEVDRGITARILPFAGTTTSFVARRNWLELEVEPQAKGRRIWASWWAEEEDEPYRKVVHPV